MNVANLIRELEFDDVKEKLILHYGEDNMEAYEKLFSELKEKASGNIEDGDFIIYIAAYYNTEDDFDLYLFYDEDDTKLSFELSPYIISRDRPFSLARLSPEQVLTCKVDERVLTQMSYANYIAHCLYDIIVIGIEDFKWLENPLA